MPPKKNGKKTQDKASKKEVTVTAEKNVFDEALSESGKDIYKAQIRDLEERLEKYQHKCDELVVRERDFSSQYNNLEREKKDMVLYLKRSLAQKEDELTDFSERLLGFQQAKDADREAFDMQLSQLRQDFQENKDKLTSENIALAGKLASLEEFRVQREEILGHMEALKDQLKKQQEEHQTVIYNLEKKAVLDNNRLRKEMHQHVAAVAAEFRRVSDKKMPEATMKAIHENVSVTAQLRQLSNRNKELVELNNRLEERERQLKREVDVLGPMLQEMTRKSVSNQTVFQQLTERCEKMQAELEEYAKSDQKHQELWDIHATLQKDYNALRQKQESIQMELVENQAEADSLRKDLVGEKTLRAHLEIVLQDAATALKDALKKVPAQEDSEAQVLARRGQIIQKLLVVLDNAAVLGGDPAPTDIIPEAGHLHQPQIDPSRGRSAVKSPLQKTSSPPSLFRTGDLGLVPRQSHVCSATLSKTEPRSKTLCLNLHRKVQSQSKNSLSNC